MTSSSGSAIWPTSCKHSRDLQGPQLTLLQPRRLTEKYGQSCDVAGVVEASGVTRVGGGRQGARDVVVQSHVGQTNAFLDPQGMDDPFVVDHDAALPVVLGPHLSGVSFTQERVTACSRRPRMR